MNAPAEDHWTLTIQKQRPSADGSGTLTQFIDIPASDDTAASWNAQFWNHFPSDPGEFAELVKGSGIGVHVDRMVALPRTVCAWYGGYTPDQLKRLVHGGQHANDEALAKLRSLLAEYERDVECDSRAMASAVAALIEERLPKPPEGYGWARERGGLIGRGYQFRLWHRAFGYMPHAE